MADLLMLQEFLQRAAAEPFVFGQWDCSMLLANWVMQVTGEDPARDLRDSYHDDAGWQALVAESGSLAVLVGRLAKVAGLSHVSADAARIGDIGVIELPAFDITAGAIFTGQKWVSKLHHGMVRLRGRPIVAWAVS